MTAMGRPFSTSGDTHIMVSCWCTKHHKHNDRHPSLSIRTVPPYTVYCHKAGCVFNKGPLAGCDLNTAIAAYFVVHPSVKLMLNRLNDAEYVYVPKFVLDGDYDKDIKALAKNAFPDEALEFMKSKGVTEKGIKAYNLLWDAANKGIVFPVLSGGRYVGAQIRPLKSAGLKYWALLPFKVSKHWFGLQHASAVGRALTIVEGPFDCVHMHEIGVRCIASMGSSVSPDKVSVLKNTVKPSRVFILMDPDDGGRGIASALSKRLEYAKIPCRILNANKDPKYLTLEEFKLIAR